MSILIPTLGTAAFDTSGERRLDLRAWPVAGLGAPGRHGTELEDHVRPTSVAITRAKHAVVLTCARRSALVDRLIV